MDHQKSKILNNNIRTFLTENLYYKRQYSYNYRIIAERRNLFPNIPENYRFFLVALL